MTRQTGSVPQKLAPWDRTKGRPEPIRFLNRIRETENGEPLVSLAEFAPSVQIHREAVIPYLRRTVAQMLEAANGRLPEGYRLGVVDAWRPFARQQRIYDFMWGCAREAFPLRDEAALRRTVCRWVAPTDQKAPPGHCTGAAVDVWLVGPSGEAVDMWSPYDRWQAAATYTLGLLPEAERMRRAMVEAMLESGFSNCRDEWWHYSYGDAGWAVRTDRTECFYGLSELPATYYAAQEDAWMEAFKDRTNPFTGAPPDPAFQKAPLRERGPSEQAA